MYNRRIESLSSEEVATLTKRTVHKCQCAVCASSEEHPDKAIHRQMNVFLSRLDEQQRRWYVALEAQQRGHGGIEEMARMTGMDVGTIRRGIRELRNDLEERPEGRTRLPGGGRPRAEKNSRA